MKIKTKPAVFAGDKVAADMLMLGVQALMVGVAAALLSGLAVVAVAMLSSS